MGILEALVVPQGKKKQQIMFGKVSRKTRWVLLGTHDMRIHKVFRVAE